LLWIASDNFPAHIESTTTVSLVKLFSELFSEHLHFT